MHQVPIETITAMYADGMSQSEIARQTGLAHYTVGYWLKKAGVPIRERCLTQDEIRQIPGLYHQGLTMAAIARHFGVAGPAVSKWMKKLGIEKDPQRQKPPKVDMDINSARLLYESGSSTEEVAARLGCNRQIVERRLSADGVSFRQNNLFLDAEQVIAAYQSGKTSEEVGAAFKCSGRTVLGILEQHGIEPRLVGPAHLLQGDTLKDVIRRYQDGHYIEDIAEVKGVSRATILSALHRSKVPLRGGGSGRVLTLPIYGAPLKFGSSWEEKVYDILHHSGQSFTFHGDFTRPDRQPGILHLKKTAGVHEVYPSKGHTYRWHPDFILPDADIILEVKGDYWATRHWHRVVEPCIQNKAANLPHRVFALYNSPRGVTDWDSLSALLVRVR